MVPTLNHQTARGIGETMTKNEAEGVIAEALRNICELPDRTSPEDQPDMMLVTGEELSLILVDALSPYIDDDQSAELARLASVERAARAFEADLSPDCDGPLRDTLRAALSPSESPLP
jgi:hypothetical protein